MELWPILVAVLGTIGGAALGLGGAVLQSRTQERTVRLQLQHERYLIEAERRAAIEDERRKEERNVLVKLLASNEGYHHAALKGAVQHIDDDVLLRMAERNDPWDSIRRRAGYLLRTLKEQRNTSGHDIPFQKPDITVVTAPPASS